MLTSATVLIERGTGRKYRLAKVYRPTGRCAERDTFRRYDIVKRYV